MSAPGEVRGRGETDGAGEVRVNGEAHPLAGESVAALLRGLGHGEGVGIAVAVNGEVVRRAGWAERTLRAGDRVEIVGAVQGG